MKFKKDIAILSLILWVFCSDALCADVEHQPSIDKGTLKALFEIAQIKGIAIGCRTSHTTARLMQEQLASNREQIEFDRIARAAEGLLLLIFDTLKKNTDVQSAANYMVKAQSIQTQANVDWSTISSLPYCTNQKASELFESLKKEQKLLNI